VSAVPWLLAVLGITGALDFEHAEGIGHRITTEARTSSRVAGQWYNMRRVRLLVLTYLALASFVGCYDDRKTAATMQGGARSKGNSEPRESHNRETQAMESIMRVFEAHSCAVRAHVEARFSPNGRVLACKVELRESVPFSRRSEREEIIREICAIVEDLGRPTPPPSLSFEVSFSTPLIIPEEG
jgi:hypothetical protein